MSFPNDEAVIQLYERVVVPLFYGKQFFLYRLAAFSDTNTQAQFTSAHQWEEHELSK